MVRLLVTLGVTLGGAYMLAETVRAKVAQSIEEELVKKLQPRGTKARLAIRSSARAIADALETRDLIDLVRKQLAS